MSIRSTFRAPLAKKAIKVAQDMGLTVTGFEVLNGGKDLRVLTGQVDMPDTAADQALAEWERSQRG